MIGKLGEEIASKYLVNLGYKILERNYNTNFAEADIIALDCDTIVIIEVKTRKNSEHIFASEAVNILKQKKLFSIANHYISINKLFDYNIRFDIIECYWESKNINHIYNAF